MTDKALDQSMITRIPTRAVADRVTDGDLELIREIGDGTAEPDDIFPFRMVASADGLDYYFTRQHDSSMKNFVRDLGKGQSVLGSHDIDTFSYGSSYAGSIQKADPEAREYEATFYRQYAKKDELATKQYVVGRYFIVRGVTLNGQPTDDLIKSMKVGGVRKASVSFTVGRYICGLDGIDMLQGWFGPWPDESEGCSHFPGVEYKKEGIAWAWMADNDLMETSLVYKNASPSAMLLRLAEGKAERGMIPKSEVTKLEERLQIRLPGHERLVYPAPSLEERMKPDAATHPETPETPETPEVPETPETPEATTTSPETPETPEAPAAPAAPAPTATAPAAPATPPMDQSRWVEIQTRDTAIAEILGGPLTVEAIRTLKADADAGAALFAEQVERVITARTSAQGADGFDPVKYRSMLLASRDVEFVASELASYEEKRKGVFTAGRSVEPIEGQDEPAAPPASTSRGLLPPSSKAKRTAARQG